MNFYNQACGQEDCPQNLMLDDHDTGRTIRDCVGSFVFMPNETIRWYFFLCNWNTQCYLVRSVLLLINGSQFSDRQFSLTFQYFSVFYLTNFTSTKMYLANTIQLKIKEKSKNKNWPNFPDFSSILGKINFSSMFKIPWLENVLSFSGFPVDVGTMDIL